MAASFGFASCVRGYHVYQETWTATEGETLICSRSKTIEQFFKPVCGDGSSSSKEVPAAAVLAAQKEMEKMHHGHSKGILSATCFPCLLLKHDTL